MNGTELFENEICDDDVRDPVNGLGDHWCWVPCFGTEFFKNTELALTMRKWCFENLRHRWGTFRFGLPCEGRTYFFENEEDAIYFKMVWVWNRLY